MSKSKAQSASEYLTNYGWVIIILLIAISFLWYSGMFNLGQSATSYDGFTRVHPIIEGIVFTNDGYFTTGFLNGAGNLIIVNEINAADHEGIGCSCSIRDGSTVISAGNTFIVDCTGCSAGHDDGDPFAIYMSVDYTMNVAGLAVKKIENGTIRGRYGV